MPPVRIEIGIEGLVGWVMVCVHWESEGLAHRIRKTSSAER